MLQPFLLDFSVLNELPDPIDNICSRGQRRRWRRSGRGCRAYLGVPRNFQPNPTQTYSHLLQARAAVEMEAQRAQLQGAADSAASRQAEVEAQNALLHEQLQRMTAGQASGDVPSPGER